LRLSRLQIEKAEHQAAGEPNSDELNAVDMPCSGEPSASSNRRRRARSLDDTLSPPITRPPSARFRGGRKTCQQAEEDSTPIM